MARCAYCDNGSEALTREHVIPAALLNATPGRETFSGKSRNIFPGQMAVKDTCAACNNGPLSRLDAMAVKAFLAHRASWVRETAREVKVQIGAKNLARWILKVCFNMARVTGATDRNALRAARSFILGAKEAPPRLHLFGGLVRSRRITPREQATLAFRGEWLDPEFQRIALWHDPLVVAEMSIARVVFVDALGFLIVKTRKGHALRPTQAVIKARFGFQPIAMSAADFLHLSPSRLDSVTSNEASFLANADVYLEHLSRSEAP